MSDQHTLYTLAEASRLTGLSTEALRLRIKRGKLASELGNDGHPRVRLTSADLEDFRRSLDQQKPTLTRQDTNKEHSIKVLEETVGILRERLGQERAALEAEVSILRAESADLRARAELAEEDLRRERERADTAEREREAARIQAATAEGEGRVLRAELARERDRATVAEREREEARGRAASAEGEGKVFREELARARDRAASAEAGLAMWSAGGPLARAWRAFLFRAGGA